MPRGAIKLCGERRSSSSSSDLKNGNDKHAHNDHDDEDDEAHSHNDDHPLVPRIKYQFNGHRLMSVSAIHSLPCALPRTGFYSLRPNPDADRSRGSPSPISMPQAAPFCQVARKEMTLAVSARGSFDAPSHSQSLSLSLRLSASASRLHLVGTVIWYWIFKPVDSSVFMFDTFDVSFALSIFWL